MLQHRESGRRHGIVLLALAVAVLLAMSSLVAWRAGWFGAEEQAAATSVPSAQSPLPEPIDARSSREAGLQLVLDARAAALTGRDREAWLATVDPQAEAFATAQAKMFDDLGPVRLSAAKLDYAGPGPSLPPERQRSLGPQAWVAKAVFAYRIEGADQADVRREQYLTMVPSGEAWLVAGMSDGPTEGVQRDLWDFAPLHSARGQRSLVIGTAPEGLQKLADQFDRAAEQVDSIWGDTWPRTVVVLVPQTQTQMAMLLGRTEENGLDQIAAVTTGEVGLPAGENADRVIVNPSGFAQLTTAGQQDVLTHEVTHVATRAAGPGTVPTWYSEGFADYVSYAERDYTLQQVAGDVLREVADGSPPPNLPTTADFDPAQHSSVTAAYSASYLAIVYLERTYSREAVIHLYRVQAGAAGPNGGQSAPMPLEQAMPKVIGVDLPAFERNFQAFVVSTATEG